MQIKHIPPFIFTLLVAFAATSFADTAGAAETGAGTRNRSASHPKQAGAVNRPAQASLANNEVIPDVKAEPPSSSESSSASKSSESTVDKMIKKINADTDKHKTISQNPEAPKASNAGVSIKNAGTKGVVATPDGTGDMNKPQL